MADADKLVAELERKRQTASPKKITFKEWEELLKVDDSTAHRMFTGEVAITLERFFQICYILNLDPVRLMERIKKHQA